MENLKIDENTIKRIKKIVQDSNINFLIGSGMSQPYLKVLWDIEKILSDITKRDDEKTKAMKDYYEWVMLWNIKILEKTTDVVKDNVLWNYKNFYKIINYLMLKRKSSILTKQVNIFTTNIDIFSEKALEETKFEFNDWFNWRFEHIFNIWNFKKSYFKKSLHYENTSEIPVFNLLKIHGSLTWKKIIDENNNEKIILDNNLDLIRNIESSSN